MKKGNQYKTAFKNMAVKINNYYQKQQWKSSKMIVELESRK